MREECIIDLLDKLSPEDAMAVAQIVIASCLTAHTEDHVPWSVASRIITTIMLAFGYNEEEIEEVARLVQACINRWGP